MKKKRIYDFIVTFDAFGKQLMTFKLSDFFTFNSHQNTFKELSGFLFTFCKLKLPFLSKSLEEQFKEDSFFRFLVRKCLIVVMFQAFLNSRKSFLSVYSIKASIDKQDFTLISVKKSQKLINVWILITALGENIFKK